MGVEEVKALGIVFIGSFVVFGTACDRWANLNEQSNKAKIHWAFSCGLISMLVSGVSLYLKTKSRGARSDPSVAAFLVFWWVLSAGLNTDFLGLFSTTDNGYFATWSSFFGALYFAYLKIHQVSGLLALTDGANGLVVLCIASCVEFSVAWDKCSKATCDAQGAWAICCGLISFLICLGHLIHAHCKPEGAANHAKPIAIFLLVWWSIGVSVITSTRGPFPSSCVSANGFFSCWLAFLSALYFCMMNVDTMRALYIKAGGSVDLSGPNSSDDLESPYNAVPEGGQPTEAVDDDDAFPAAYRDGTTPDLSTQSKLPEDNASPDEYTDFAALRQSVDITPDPTPTNPADHGGPIMVDYQGDDVGEEL